MAWMQRVQAVMRYLSHAHTQEPWILTAAPAPSGAPVWLARSMPPSTKGLGAGWEPDALHPADAHPIASAGLVAHPFAMELCCDAVRHTARHPRAGRRALPRRGVRSAIDGGGGLRRTVRGPARAAVLSWHPPGA